MNTKTAYGVEVRNLTYKNPGNNLPKFVRDAAETRGYGDAVHPLSLFVNRDDVDEAFACAAQGDGSSCVMAQAGTRIGASGVYFYRTTAWIDFGEGPVVRFTTSKSIYDNVIAPFDEGDRDSVKPGIYHLTPPDKGRNLESRRKWNQRPTGKNPSGRNRDGSRSAVIQSHTERVVMSSRV